MSQKAFFLLNVHIQAKLLLVAFHFQVLNVLKSFKIAQMAKIIYFSF